MPASQPEPAVRNTVSYIKLHRVEILKTIDGTSYARWFGNCKIADDTIIQQMNASSVDECARGCSTFSFCEMFTYTNAVHSSSSCFLRTRFCSNSSEREYRGIHSWEMYLRINFEPTDQIHPATSLTKHHGLCPPSPFNKLLDARGRCHEEGASNDAKFNGFAFTPFSLSFTRSNPNYVVKTNCLLLESVCSIEEMLYPGEPEWQTFRKNAVYSAYLRVAIGGNEYLVSADKRALVKNIQILSSIHTSNARDCAVVCGANLGCTSFVLYDSVYHNCEILKRRMLSAGPVQHDSWTIGKVYIRLSFSTKVDGINATKYAYDCGKNILVLRTDNISECNKRCYNDTNCKAFLFTDTVQKNEAQIFNCVTKSTLCSPSEKVSKMLLDGWNRYVKTTALAVEPGCGKPDISPDLSIANDGKAVRKNSFPWHVHVDVDRELTCGGALISPQHVLTAAHCVTEESIYLGLHNTANPDEPGVQLRHVKSVLVHPRYNPNTEDFDIAVLNLHDPVEITNSTKTICLAYTTAPDDTYCYVTGFGATNENHLIADSEILRQIFAPILSFGKCNSTLINLSNGTRELRHSMHCAGGNGGQAPCPGDGGGPLVCFSNNRWELNGLVSWGQYGSCGKSSRVPGLYLNVPRYDVSKWIRDNTEYDESDEKFSLYKATDTEAPGEPNSMLERYRQFPGACFTENSSHVLLSQKVSLSECTLLCEERDKCQSFQWNNDTGCQLNDDNCPRAEVSAVGHTVSFVKLNQAVALETVDGTSYAIWLGSCKLKEEEIIQRLNTSTADKCAKGCNKVSFCEMFIYTTSANSNTNCFIRTRFCSDPLEREYRGIPSWRMYLRIIFEPIDLSPVGDPHIKYHGHCPLDQSTPFKRSVIPMPKQSNFDACRRRVSPNNSSGWHGFMYSPFSLAFRIATPNEVFPITNCVVLESPCSIYELLHPGEPQWQTLYEKKPSYSGYSRIWLAGNEFLSKYDDKEDVGDVDLLTTTGTATAKDCAALCVANLACTLFVYQEWIFVQNCKTMRKLNTHFVGTANKLTIGRIVIRISFLTEVGGIKKTRYNYNCGRTILELRTNSVSECSKRCYSDANCKGFLFTDTLQKYYETVYNCVTKSELCSLSQRVTNLLQDGWNIYVNSTD